MMTISLAIIFACLVGSYFFSGTETALVAMLRRQKHQSDISANLSRWLDRPEDILSFTLVGNNICNILASSIATKLLIERFGSSGEVYSIVSMSVILLIFCEVIPKSAALRHPKAFAGKAITPLNMSAIVLKPLSKAASALSSLLVRVVYLFIHQPKPADIEDFESIANRGALDVGESKEAMIHRLFEVSDMRAFDLMIPRSNIETVRIDELPRKTSSKIIAVENEEGDIVGLHHYNDCAETAFFPENTPILRLFAMMFESHIESALIVNEHGEVTGAIERTRVARFLSGIPEALYADIFKSGKIFVVEGAMEITALEELLGEDFPKGPFKTVGGFIEEFLHKIPRSGFRFRWGGYIFTIFESSAKKISRVKIERVDE